MNKNVIDNLKNLLKTTKLNYSYFILITGASGVGKTTLLKALERESLENLISINYFDSVGVPSIEEMIARYGSGEKWQQAMTYQWVDRLLQVKDKKLIFLEGSINPEFIREAFARNEGKRYFITPTMD
jgi:predicted AAA+ superfamily ATPase